MRRFVNFYHFYLRIVIYSLPFLSFAITSPRQTSGFAIDVGNLLVSWASLFALVGGVVWVVDRSVSRIRGAHAT